jgi:hypothetical protein
MATTKHMGRGKLVERLAAQVGSRDMAVGILRKRGDLKQGSEQYTKKGEKRNRMTAEERALDRTSKTTGAKKSDLVYNPKTNRATRK